MWLILLLPVAMIGLFVFLFSFPLIGAIKNKEKRERISHFVKRLALTLLVIIAITLTIFQVGGFRLDTAGGQHIIIPTAIDTDVWGNYKVYYKTTMYESNQSEGYYMIEKERLDLVEQIQKYMRERKQIIVHYNRYIGFKGISSPRKAPIIQIEQMD